MDRADLHGVVVFLAVAEHGGFRAAARMLGLTPSAVSQGIQRLEARLGAPLFTRTTRSVGLTEAGARLLAHARPATETLQAGLDAAAGLGTDPRGRLRINAPRAALGLLLGSVVPGFMARHPSVEVELVGEDAMVDIVAEGFDAGVRFGHLVQKDMVTTRLTPPDSYVVVASPALLAEVGRPGHPRELTGYPCIAYLRDGGEAEPWRFAARGRASAVSVHGRLAMNDVAACLQGALQGLGFFRLARSLAHEHLERGALVTVLDEYAHELPSLCLYYPSRSQSLPKLRAFVDFVRELGAAKVRSRARKPARSAGRRA